MNIEGTYDMQPPSKFVHDPNIDGSETIDYRLPVLEQVADRAHHGRRSL